MFGREEIKKPNPFEPSEVIEYIFQSIEVMDKMETRIKELEAELRKQKVEH